MRTIKEILVKYQVVSDAFSSTFDFEASDILQFVPYGQAHPHLNNDVTPVKWEEF
ncbi:unnamed protein product, partial [marine sediment metagenome]